MLAAKSGARNVHASEMLPVIASLARIAFASFNELQPCGKVLNLVQKHSDELTLRDLGVSEPVIAIDYSCDNKKITLGLWRIIDIIAQLETSGSQKCLSLTLSKHLFVRKLKRIYIYPARIVNAQPQLLRIRLFW
jgi:hypothetical protein